MASAFSKKGESAGRKACWRQDVEQKLEEASAIVVRSSGKAATRPYRIALFSQGLMKAQVDAAFYQASIRLEERQAAIEAGYGSLKLDSDVDALETQLGRTTVSGPSKGQQRGRGEGRGPSAEEGDPVRSCWRCARDEADERAEVEGRAYLGFVGESGMSSEDWDQTIETFRGEREEE